MAALVSKVARLPKVNEGDRCSLLWGNGGENPCCCWALGGDGVGAAETDAERVLLVVGETSLGKDTLFDCLTTLLGRITTYGVSVDLMNSN